MVAIVDSMLVLTCVRKRAFFRKGVACVLPGAFRSASVQVTSALC